MDADESGDFIVLGSTFLIAEYFDPPPVILINYMSISKPDLRKALSLPSGAMGTESEPRSKLQYKQMNSVILDSFVTLFYAWYVGDAHGWVGINFKSMEHLRIANNHQSTSQLNKECQQNIWNLRIIMVVNGIEVPLELVNHEAKSFKELMELTVKLNNKIDKKEYQITQGPSEFLTSRNIGELECKLNPEFTIIHNTMKHLLFLDINHDAISYHNTDAVRLSPSMLPEINEALEIANKYKEICKISEPILLPAHKRQLAMLDHIHEPQAHPPLILQRFMTQSLIIAFEIACEIAESHLKSQSPEHRTVQMIIKLKSETSQVTEEYMFKNFFKTKAPPGTYTPRENDKFVICKKLSAGTYNIYKYFTLLFVVHFQLKRHHYVLHDCVRLFVRSWRND